MNRATHSARDDARAVRGPGQSGNSVGRREIGHGRLISMALIGEERFSCGRIPYLHDLVRSPRGKVLPISPRDAQRVVLFAEAASIARSMLRLLSGKGSETVLPD